MRIKQSPVVTLCVLMIGCGLLVPERAEAADNDIQLERFATFERITPATPPPDGRVFGTVEQDDAKFRALVKDLGQVFGPRVGSPAETLGEAGFAFVAMPSLSFIDNSADYWRDGVEDRSPGSALFTSHLQVRKGLPFSLELAANFGYMFNSEMFTLGADIKAALIEGFYYLPDVAGRGSVVTLQGSEDLNLINASWDIVLSKTFGISGVVSLSPYGGYQQLYIIASSRLLNAYPQDPRPPQFDRDNPENRFTPEFVFRQTTQTVNRFFLGARLNVWILSFSAEGIIGDGVNQANFAAGVDF